MVTTAKILVENKQNPVSQCPVIRALSGICFLGAAIYDDVNLTPTLGHFGPWCSKSCYCLSVGGICSSEHVRGACLGTIIYNPSLGRRIREVGAGGQRRPGCGYKFLDAGPGYGNICSVMSSG